MQKRSNHRFSFIYLKSKRSDQKSTKSSQVYIQNVSLLECSYLQRSLICRVFLISKTNLCSFKYTYNFELKYA